MTDVREADRSGLLDLPADHGDLATADGTRRPGRVTDGRAGLPHRDMPQARFRWKPLLMFLLFMSPTILAGVYYGLFATGRYVSTAEFVVRTASKPAGDTGLGAFLRMAGLGRAEDDTYSVKNFIESRDAVKLLQEKLPLADMYGRGGADFLSRYPSILYGATNEELFRYYVHMTKADYNSSSGVTTLTVQAFDPQDSLAIAINVLSLAENLVNQLNTRIRADAEQTAEKEVRRQEERLTNAQVAITSFQNKETMIDPTNNSIIVSEIVGKLQNDLAQTQARVTDMKTAAPNNPGLTSLERQAQVTQAQIDHEAARVTSSQEGLADKLGQYQRLVLEREFSTKALSVANAALDNARIETRRKQLYIERIVEPNLSDKTTLPLRLWTTFTVLVVNLLTVFILWMLLAGVREHISSTR